MNTSKKFRMVWALLLLLQFSLPVYAASSAALEESMINAYLAEPGARAAEIAAFDGREQPLDMEEAYLQEIRGWNDGAYAELTVGKRRINDTPLYEVYRDDDAAKPLILFFHGGGEGANKTEFMDTACQYALDGFYALCVDVAGYGESDLGPIDAMVGAAETVQEIDGLIEYYNTLPNVDAGRFCLYGHSMGGFVAFDYAAHGRYTPTAIACSCSTPNLVEIHEWPLYATTDHGIHIPTILSQEEIYRFAEAYSPIHWPERFLDVTVYACNGLSDEIVFPTGCQELEAKLTDLGGERFTFLYMEDRGHGDQYVLEDFQPRDTLLAAVADAKTARPTKKTLEGIGVSFLLPAGWTDYEDFCIAYMSPEQDRELAFWLLEGESQTLEEQYARLLEEQKSNPNMCKQLEIKELSGMRYLFYVDDAGQFVAYIPCGAENTLYMSLTDNGQGDAQFLEIIDSIARLNPACHLG